MRVCFLNHTLDDRTGAGHFLQSLLRAMQSLDSTIKPDILTASASGDPRERAIIPTRREAFVGALGPIRRVFRQADIIHALDGYPFGVVAAIANLGIQRPLITTAIGTGALQPLHRRILGPVLRWAYRRADRLVAVSNYTRRELIPVLPDVRIDVIHHGVDVSEFNVPATLDAEASGSISRLRPYVLSVGALKPRKGYRHSLAVFAELRNAMPSLRYVIVGDGDRDTLHAQAERLGVADAVTLLRNIPREFLRELYRSAELFLLMPEFDRGDVEGFGLVFLEAAAAGTPAIAALGSGAEDAVADGDSGYLVPSGDVGTATIRAKEILSSRELREKLSQGARDFAEKMSWQAAAQEYISLYRELCQERRSGV